MYITVLPYSKLLGLYFHRKKWDFSGEGAQSTRRMHKGHKETMNEKSLCVLRFTLCSLWHQTI
jgi:hypothetical protein